MLDRILGIPFGYVIGWCYSLCGSYVAAIVLFTLITKAILFPVSLWTGRNSLKMVAMMPELDRLKVKYYGDKATIAEETQKLYKREHYHPLASLLPMCIQLVLLGGVIGAVRQVLGQSGGVLTLIPSQTGGPTYLMPLATGAAALLLGVSQNHINPLQREQARTEQLTTNAISIMISLVLGAFVPVGVGVYWIASNLFSILQQLVVNAILRPEKYVDYEALRQSREELSNMDSLAPKTSREEKRRERADYKRFFSVANKHLVFYSEKSGFYKYFKNVIEYLLEHSNVIVHYVTNDPQDQVFELAKTQPRIKPYYISQTKAITLFMKMDADIVVMTTPDLDNFYLKRSYVRKDIEYIYMFHGIGSTNMVVRKGAYDHFDTVLCVGQHQIDELRETEAMYQLPAKTLVPCGYGMFDDMVAAYKEMRAEEHSRPQILIAPSWQEGNILDSCIDEILVSLSACDYDIIIRPHPEYVKRFPDRMNALLARYGGSEKDHITIEADFSSNQTIFRADLLITDWSGIAYEFSFCTLRPCLFVDTPMKVLNPEYVKYDHQPTDITWRDQVGKSLSPSDASGIAEAAEELLRKKESYRLQIEALRKSSIFHVGESGEIGAKYILKTLMEKKYEDH